MNARKRRGFALVIVLWVLAGLAVIAVSVATLTRNMALNVRLLRDRLSAEQAFISTSSRIAVIASTAAPQRSSLDSERGRLFVDGRLTQVSDTEWVTLQDTRGLVNLNRPNAQRLLKLLQRCGASEAQAQSLADALADYVDADSLKRINGAETFEYRSRDLVAPRNAELLSRDELWRVFGFAEIRPRWNAAGCDNFVTVRGDSFANRNTSPYELLLADGLTEASARALVNARADGLPSLEIQTEGADPSNPFNIVGGGFAGEVLRVHHEKASVEWTLEYELELTPQRNGGPWRIHELRYPSRLADRPRPGARMPAVDFRIPERDRTNLDAASRLPFAN
ncbi:general secretion pathway protein GspK [Pelomonas sp. V22]|uniref:general secretion pathway protein GspK n=1 Tax=Pelomonas sp. V22 TaxID=2822139 RepID=UPI0024A805DA|nr:type II secretion system protein GspK [Pelomonas sp. V22]MDI4632513.1 general secretion pathway protein GspK [Pelomonas sp. V22]